MIGRSREFSTLTFSAPPTDKRFRSWPMKSTPHEELAMKLNFQPMDGEQASGRGVSPHGVYSVVRQVVLTYVISQSNSWCDHKLLQKWQQTRSHVSPLLFCAFCIQNMPDLPESSQLNTSSRIPWRTEWLQVQRRLVIWARGLWWAGPYCRSVRKRIWTKLLTSAGGKANLCWQMAMRKL